MAKRKQRTEAQKKRPHCKGCAYINRIEVPYEGTRQAKIVIVGESPGVEEEKLKRPFVGKSGLLLNRLIKHINLRRESLFISNSCRCRILKDKDSTKDINASLLRCRHYLVTAIKAVRPKLIVCLGAYAFQQVVSGKSIMKNRGRFMASEEFDCPVFVTVHPAYILRGSTRGFLEKPLHEMNMKEKLLFTDFTLVQEFIRQGYRVPSISTKGYRLGTDRDLDKFHKARVVAFDYETNSLDVHSKNTKVLSVSFSKDKDISLVYILRGKKISPEIKRLLQNPNVAKAVANRTFEDNITRLRFGFDIKGDVHDVLTMAHLLDENSYGYNLEAVANTYTTKRNIKDLAEGMRMNLDKAPDSVLIRYNGVDSDATLEAFNTMSQLLQKDSKLTRYYKKFLYPIQTMFTEISTNGCLIDKTALRKSENEAQELSEKYERKALRLIPKSIKAPYKGKERPLRKPELIRQYMFTHEDGLLLAPLPKFITPKTKVPSVSEDHLKQFEGVPFITNYTKYIKVEHTESNYLSKLWKQMKGDGKVYPRTLLTRTVTGRTAMVEPTIQNIPQHHEFAYLVRRVFRANKGWVLNSRDLSQSELRIIGWIANDHNIMEALRKGIDLHVLTASLINKIPLHEVTEQMRQKAKAINFGFIYGMSPEGFQTYAKVEYGLEFSLEECYQIRADFFGRPNGYYSLPVYHELQRFKVKRDGYVRCILGRVRRLPKAQTGETKYEKWEAGAQAINTPIQNFSSELGELGMHLFHLKVKANADLHRNIKPLWFIHDNTFFQSNRSYARKGSLILKDCMENEAKIYIKKNFGITVGYPIETDAKSGLTWETMKKVKY